MRRAAIVVAAALVAATAALAVAGAAVAQSVAVIAVLPQLADPGGVVTVSSGPSSPCEPPRGTPSPFASVDLFASGTATPVNRAPYQGVVAPSGTWSIEVRLAPDLPPGTYRVQAGCYTDSGLNSGFGPTYSAGQLDVRLQVPGPPSLSARRGRPGETMQVVAGDAACPPPAGAPSPRVRVSLLDATGSTRAEAEAPVDARTGRWAVGVRVPDVGPQSATVTAVCLARVGASAPYARYQAAPFTIDPSPQATSTSAPPAPTTTTTAPGPGGTVAPPSTASAAIPVAELPPTPLAVAVTAEPTYTG